MQQDQNIQLLDGSNARACASPFLSAHMPACLSGCLPVCPPVCLPLWTSRASRSFCLLKPSHAVPLFTLPRSPLVFLFPLSSFHYHALSSFYYHTALSPLPRPSPHRWLVCTALQSSQRQLPSQLPARVAPRLPLTVMASLMCWSWRTSSTTGRLAGGRSAANAGYGTQPFFPPHHHHRLTPSSP